MNTNHTTYLALEGMTCGSCVRRVRTVLLARPGVRDAEIRLRDREARVVHDGPLDLAPLVRELAEHGYTARLATATPDDR